MLDVNRLRDDFPILSRQIPPLSFLSIASPLHQHGMQADKLTVRFLLFPQLMLR